MSAEPQFLDDHALLSAEVIRREIGRLIDRTSGVTCSIVIVKAQHAGSGTLAKIFVDIDAGAKKVELVLMLERLRLSLDDFSTLVLAPVFRTSVFTAKT